MSLATFADVARMMGWRSRSTLYRLRDDGRLAQYLRPGGRNGAQLLELHPPGLPPLRDYLRGVVRLQWGSPALQQLQETERRQQLANRRGWELVAGALREAMEAAGEPLTLTAPEAEVIAQNLPQAVADAFGGEGLERLRRAMADAGCWRVGRGHGNVEIEREWWSEWGRWAPTEPLEDEPFWHNLGAMVAAMLAPPFDRIDGPTMAELWYQIQGAVHAIELGARWDQARWDQASVQLLLEDGDQSPQGAAELEAATARGLLPAALQARALEALDRYRQRAQTATDPTATSAGKLAPCVLENTR